MTNLQHRYLRNTLTAWMIVAGIFFVFWWAIPVNPEWVPIGFLVGCLVYGLWFFRGE